MEKDGIEQFPVMKRQIRMEEPPELIFFDVDETEEEADFIRVDDLFAMHGEMDPEFPARFTFTLIPGKKGQMIPVKCSRMIHRTMILSAVRLEHKIDKIRIRPLFLQWQMTLEAADDPGKLVREFREDLEDFLGNYINLKENECYWADSCFVCPDSALMDDDWIRETALAWQTD